MLKISALIQSEMVVLLRNSKVSMSGLMLIVVVDSMLTTTHKKFYVGEIHAKYCEISKRLDMKETYSYQGVYQMLRKLVKANLLNSSKDGKYMMYSLTSKSHVILDNLTFKPSCN